MFVHPSVSPSHSNVLTCFSRRHLCSLEHSCLYTQIMPTLDTRMSLVVPVVNSCIIYTPKHLNVLGHFGQTLSNHMPQISDKFSNGPCYRGIVNFLVYIHYTHIYISFKYLPTVRIRYLPSSSEAFYFVNLCYLNHVFNL